MSHLESQEDECFILVKAQPHRSSNYFETVCCAGIGRDGKWRRQYPVPFRILNQSQKFGRWQWIRYRYSTSPKDRRRESQKVVPESISLGEKLRQGERARFLNPLVRSSLSEADARGESLTIVRPVKFEFISTKKKEEDIETERAKHAHLANQLSIWDKTARPLDPCPYEFIVNWTSESGSKHQHIADDWESAQAFRNFERQYGEEAALEALSGKYRDYFERGLVCAFSTHKRRNATFGTKNQWLLVGLIRLDRSPQGDMFLR
ncbi:hypothetical protein [Hyphobacterium sp.]|uniref:hypothetical protein n=1 Tax=Hyphobacterium sp. TaxID=2004662 RepID=UPI003B51B104